MNMGKLVGVAVVVLALSGCGAAVASDDTARTVAPEVVARAEASATPTAEPTATAEPVAAPIEMAAAPIDPATPWGEAGFESGEAWYLASVTSVWQGEPTTAEQLLGAGALACQEIAGGARLDTITVVTGDSPDAILNNSRVVNYADMALCP